MFCRCTSWLTFMLVAQFVLIVYSDPDSTKERSTTESVREVRQPAAEDLGALLDAGAGAIVTLVAGDTRLAAHRAVLEARSPVLAAMLRHYTVQVSGGRLGVAGVGGPALRHLLGYLYTLRIPQLPGLAPQLLAAAHRYGLSDLKADCERQVAAQLSVETAAAVAVLAVEHSLHDLRDAAVHFIRDHFVQVLATKGWRDAVVNRPKEVVQVSRLLSSRLTGTSDLNGNRQTTPTAALATRPESSPTIEGTAISHLLSLSDDEKGRRLIEAAEEGEVEEVQSLLDAGADVGARDEGGSTALHWAAYRGHTEVAKRLLEAGADANATDNWQNSPLHVAAWSGHTAVTRLLAAAAADPSARDKEGRTPLHLAVLRGHTRVVTALLEAGADREATDESGNTPLDITRQGNGQQLIAVLSAPATTGDRATFTTPPDSDLGGHGQTTPTAAPATSPRSTTTSEGTAISHLPSLSDDEKGRRLIEAAEEGAVEELQSLLDAGADVGARDVVGSTALHWAAYRGHAEVAKRLLEAGAEVNATDSLRNSPLHVAAWSGHTAVVRLLAAAAADTGARDEKGRTPLHLAALRGHTRVVTALLEAGADREATDQDGNTPLDLARQGNWKQLIGMLSASATTKAGATPTTPPRSDFSAHRQTTLTADLATSPRSTPTTEGTTTSHLPTESGVTPTTPVHSDFSGPRQTTTTAAPTTPPRSSPTTEGTAVSRLLAPATTEAWTTTSTQPHSSPGQTPAASPPQTSACPTSPLNEATVSRLRRLPVVMKNKRLRKAAWAGKVAEVRSLLAAGADVHARDPNMWTAMDWAAKGPVQVVSCLLDAGGSVDTQDRTQQTSLHWAAKYGHAPVVRLMAAASTDINARDKWGYTALHWAAWKGNAEAAAALLEAGADRRVTTAQGKTPLDIASSRGGKRVVAVLTSS